MALVIATTVAAVRVASDPTNAARAVQSAASVVHNVATGTIDVMQGVYFQDKNLTVTGAKCLGNAALATVDAAVYAVAVIIPVIPIGWAWSTLRRQQ